MARADHTKEHMGLTSWRNAPNGKIVKADVSIAKNYLSVDEMQELNEIVTMYLDYATRQARRHIPMTMADWASKLDAFLQFNDAEILQDKGKVTAAIAKAFAESEFEQYRIIQDRLYQSDFDRLVAASAEKDLVLYRRKKILRNMTVDGVINGSGINIRDFLVETALAGPDFLYFGNQMVKIILIEDLAVDQPAFI